MRASVHRNCELTSASHSHRVLDSFIDEEEEEEGLVSGHDDMHREDHSPQTRKSAARNEELERWDWSDDDDDARGTNSNGRAATR